MARSNTHVDFVHLNVVSSASPRYGTAEPEELVQRAAELGQGLLALTDRDSVSGAVKHVRACQRAGVRPVLGCDLAVAAPGGGRVLLLARGRRGWSWLCRLITRAHEHDPAALPLQELEQAQDVVALLGPGSDVGLTLAAGRPGQAERLLKRWHARTETVLEAVEHYLPGQRSQARSLLALAERTRTMAVLTNAVRYPAQEGAEVAHVLDQARRWLPGGTPPGPATAQAHLKDGAAMFEVAQRLVGEPAAARRLIAHTNALAASCALDPDADLGMDRTHLPRFEGPREHLWHSCEEGLHRLGLDRDDEARHRLAEELGIIEHKGLSAYFLTVAGAADRIRDKGIRCSIRGSGTGSLVNHLLGISAVNPLDHGLLMERFLTLSRKGLPDVDLDVESARRLEAYDAVFAAYPDTACVSMMETYRARSAIRDVGAAMGVPPHEIDRLAKAFPHVRARRIRSAAQDLPELRGLDGSGVSAETARTLFRLAEHLDGLPRHAAMHPCGLVVSDSSLAERTPLLPSRAGYPMVAFDKDDVEEMGLIKLDVIGVRMQSAMATAREEVERTTGSAPDLEELPQDPHVYEMVASSNTLGCFQVESPGQRELVSRLRPACMEDLIVDISLFRPGPVGSDMIGPYLEARDGKAPARPPAPILSQVLAETGGVVVFHEQVLKVLHTMTACGLDRAEAMRRCLSSEQGREQVRQAFTGMAADCGHDEATVAQVWRVLSSFGSFGFCKAHAAAFALPTYQSAWLKRHHPAAFYAGVLTHDPGMYPRRAVVEDARRFGVAVLGVDVNRSGQQWRVELTGQGVWGVRACLEDVRALSGAEIERILAERPFHSLPDAAARARLSREALDNLVRVGAFDALYGIGEETGAVHRRELLLQVSALERAGRTRVGAGQSALEVAGSAPQAHLPPMSAEERTGAELQVLGYEVERHLLEGHAEVLAALAADHHLVRARDLHLVPTGGQVLVAGVKVATQTPAVRSGQRIIFTTVDDATGLVDLTFFESVQERCAATVFGAWLLVARGRVRRAGSGMATVTATHALDLVELGRAWQEGGRPGLARAVHAPGACGPGVGGGRVRHVTGMTVSPYADLRSDPVPSRGLWHASPGSSGG
ncbi:DNA polymerase III subunit alpha [Nocardiopsis salina]|uniref:DNA polymerase III subunit alpha n=1 Tax=Nocardiopsis salina TaxID=245836 RepID=UPI00034AF999|nr:DNA polymerase III subunit alpha [Nocardiopsis salina]